MKSRLQHTRHNKILKENRFAEMCFDYLRGSVQKLSKSNTAISFTTPFVSYSRDILYLASGYCLSIYLFSGHSVHNQKHQTIRLWNPISVHQECVHVSNWSSYMATTRISSIARISSTTRTRLTACFAVQQLDSILACVLAIWAYKHTLIGVGAAYTSAKS
jgi:hypothetical protein